MRREHQGVRFVLTSRDRVGPPFVAASRLGSFQMSRDHQGVRSVVAYALILMRAVSTSSNVKERSVSTSRDPHDRPASSAAPSSANLLISADQIAYPRSSA
jgi:hypothetical protein